MKNHFTLLLCLILMIGNPIYGQLGQGTIEPNTIKAKVFSDGGIQELQTFADTSFKTLIYADGLWLAGMDTNTNVLHQSSQTYRQGNPEFFPGPVSNDPNASIKYDRVYNVSLNTLTNFKNGNTTGIPQEIADWPAHGDTTMGEAYYLAPFVDVNNDGHYIPADGDYPKIKGDEALYTITNDVNGRLGFGLGAEVHSMLYGYNTGGIEDSVLFREYRIINRSNNDYTSCYLSLWADFDLGNPGDDLVGCNVNADGIFVYNADNDDEGPSGFGPEPPTCGIRILQGPPAPYFDGVDNDRDGCIDGVRDASGTCIAENPSTGVREQMRMTGSLTYANTFTNSGNPSTSMDYYLYMQSKWKNSNNLIIENPSGFLQANNGDGYVANNTGTVTKYHYPGNSIDTMGVSEPFSPVDWFMSPNNLNDMRSLANAGPFTLLAGEEFTTNIAYVWDLTSSSDNGYTGINKLLERLDGIYNNQPTRTVGLNAYKVNANYQLSFNTSSAEWAVSNKQGGKMTFEVYTTTGQLMNRLDVDSGSKRTIPTEGFAKGVYLLVETQSGEAHKITK